MKRISFKISVFLVLFHFISYAVNPITIGNKIQSKHIEKHSAFTAIGFHNQLNANITTSNFFDTSKPWTYANRSIGLVSIGARDKGVKKDNIKIILTKKDKKLCWAPKDFSVFNSSLTGNTYTVTNGLELVNALTKVIPGDTVLMEGGIYVLNSRINITVSGTPDNPIRLLVNPGQSRPKLDFSAMPENSANQGIVLSANYWNIKGIDIVKAGDNGLQVKGSNNKIEFCTFSECADTGLQIDNSAANNTILNCDSYYNADSTLENADGFACKLTAGTGNKFIGCRAWQNLDDGWDGYLRGTDNIFTTYQNCWAIKNGYLKNGNVGVGDGNGFKTGGSDLKNLKHNAAYKNCIAVGNVTHGFDHNSNRGEIAIYNCSAYNNGVNYSFGATNPTGKLTIKNSNVLGFYGSTLATLVDSSNNSWQDGIAVAESDFKSIDYLELLAPRKTDGSLPDVNFFHLNSTSGMINKGIFVDLPFIGVAPDIGAFEDPFVPNPKTDVWDFGGATLDTNLYNNKLTVADINSWYTYSGTIVLGTTSTSNTLTNSVVQTLTPGVLTLKTGNNDRLYATVSASSSLTRYGTSIGTTDTNYSGRYNCNGLATATTRFFTMTLAEDDEVTIVTSAESANNTLTIVNTTAGTNQVETIPIVQSGSAVSLVKFQAKQAGDFKISCLSGKGNYYRIMRKPATYISLTGNLDVSQASQIPNGYSVVFTNAAGKSWNAPVTSGSYTVNIPAGYTYQLSLANANGFIISNGSSLLVLDTTTNYNITIQQVNSFSVSGLLMGLGTDISKITSLMYTPSEAKIFVPNPIINKPNAAYTVELEPNTTYTIAAQGINDYEILANTITITGMTVADVTFTKKPVYPITITTTGLDAAQIASLTLTFTNINESGYVYTFVPGSPINLRSGTYSISYSGLNNSTVVMSLTSNLKVTDATVSKTLDFVAPEDTSALPYAAVITVGVGKDYPTINKALVAITRMTSRGSQRVTVLIDPGNYEEMLDITQVNVTLKNASTTPNINLLNKGVDIDPEAVRITSYYGLGYNYYSMKNNQKWDADVLRVNKENGYQPYTNVSGSTNNSYWNATLLVSASGFIAEDIIIENSYNQYISLKESQDVVELASGNKGVRPTTYRSTAVQDKSFVERAAAFAVKNGVDKVILNKCRVVGRQDSFFGGTASRVVVYKGVMMGGTDYLFGGMNAVFYQTDLAMNTSDNSSDTCYITAAQQATGRGYLMYECKITTAIPGTETASTMRSKPGFFGRPWAALTSEVVFYNTTIEKSNYTGYVDKSLIMPLGWNNSLSGESSKMYEFGTIENSGIDNSSSRATWATKLTVPTLTDGTVITTFNFTKGVDNWDPLPQLIANESLGIKNYQATTSVNVYGYKNNIVVSKVKSKTQITVYNLNGSIVKTFNTNTDTIFNINPGVWIVMIKAADGQKWVKLLTN